MLSKTDFMHLMIKLKVISNMCINDNEIVATNGNVMSIGTLQNGIGQKLLLSPSLANEIIKDFADDDKIKITIKDTKIIIWNDNLKIESNMQNGEYPLYNQLLPQSDDNRTIKINKAELLKNLDIMSLVVEYAKPVIKMIFKNDNTLTMETKDGQTVMSIENCTFAEPFEIYFNVHFLISALKSTNGEFVYIQLNQPLSAAVLKSESQSRAYR